LVSALSPKKARAKQESLLAFSPGDVDFAKSRRRPGLTIVAALVTVLISPFLFNGCGQNQYFANRTLPPSGILNRCMVAIQNPSPITKGSLQILDAYYDIRHAYNNINTTYFVAGYSGADPPATIQNLAVQQTGVVAGVDGSLQLINYQSEKQTSAVSGFSSSTQVSSVFAAQNLNYYVAAEQQVHAFTVVDQTSGGGSFPLNVSDIYRVSVNPSGTVALGFVQNSNDVYSIVRLTSQQQQQLKAGPSTWPTLYPGVTVQDCEPQNLPIYCAVKVNDPNGLFDRPIRTVFSSDGSTAYVVNCGPECGGTQAGIVTIPLTASSLNVGVSAPSAINLVPASVIATPGGATDALQNGSVLYVAGQQLQTSGPYTGLFTGNLTVVNLANNTIAGGPYSISDGNHTKMILGDDNTLWIGSQNCEEGVRFAESQAGNTSVSLGCLTEFNTSNNSVIGIDTYKGDLTGVTSIEGLEKVYVAEGGQVHIYNTNTSTLTERDNSNVTVTGTAYDVAYMDAADDGDNANY
jgi:hypothetical protein